MDNVYIYKWTWPVFVMRRWLLDVDPWSGELVELQISQRGGIKNTETQKQISSQGHGVPQVRWAFINITLHTLSMLRSRK